VEKVEEFEGPFLVFFGSADILLTSKRKMLLALLRRRKLLLILLFTLLKQWDTKSYGNIFKYMKAAYVHPRFGVRSMPEHFLKKTIPKATKRCSLSGLHTSNVE
jgi:hypothetical protein